RERGQGQGSGAAGAAGGGRRPRSATDRIVSVRSGGIAAALLATVSAGADAQDTEGNPPRAPVAAPAHQPHLSLRKAQVLGAAAGLALGAALGARSESPAPALTPLGAGDVAIAGTAVALYASAEVLARRPADAAAALAPVGPVNDFDRTIRSFAVGHRSL